jgi:hypothetical protein
MIIYSADRVHCVRKKQREVLHRSRRYFVYGRWFVAVCTDPWLIEWEVYGVYGLEQSESHILGVEITIYVTSVPLPSPFPLSMY